MTDLTIPALDHGKIRVFSVAAPLTDDLRAKSGGALTDLFGTDALNPDFVDIFDMSALGELTLPDYLRTGYDLSPDGVDMAALQDLAGVVVLVMSRATGGEERTLQLAPTVTHVTTLGNGATMSMSQPIQSDAAKGVLDGTPAKKPMSDARMSGMVATVALLVMFALVALMVWIGG